jgi:hypothetical protein
MTEARFNKGHVKGLRDIGILGPRETGLPPTELVRRAIERDRLDEVISYVSQELTHSVSDLQLAQFYLETAEMLLADSGAKNLTEIVEKLEEVRRLYSKATHQAPVMNQCFELLSKARAATGQQTPMTEFLAYYWEAISQAEKTIEDIKTDITPRMQRISTALNTLE